MQNRRPIALYIACSLDGYLAGPGDDLSFLDEIPHPENEDYGYANFIAQVDCVIVGRKTYDWVMTQVPDFPHADKTTYVITRTPRPSQGKTHFYTGDLQLLVEQLRAESGKTIYCDGGSEVILELLRLGAIDEMIVAVIPVLLGDGIRLFRSGFEKQHLTLLGTTTFDNGLVQLRYRVQQGVPASE